jgi:outer membrane lipoprotein-sorting protein
MPIDIAREPTGNSELALQQNRGEASYLKMGTEQLGPRRATKYQARNANETEPATASFIWVDDELGMPIRSETSHSNAAGSVRVIMELSDIALEIEQSLFDLPRDYQKVEYARLQDDLAKTPQ